MPEGYSIFKPNPVATGLQTMASIFGAYQQGQEERKQKVFQEQQQQFALWQQQNQKVLAEQQKDYYDRQKRIDELNETELRRQAKLAPTFEALKSGASLDTVLASPETPEEFKKYFEVKPVFAESEPVSPPQVNPSVQLGTYAAPAGYNVFTSPDNRSYEVPKNMEAEKAEIELRQTKLAESLAPTLMKTDDIERLKSLLPIVQSGTLDDPSLKKLIDGLKISDISSDTILALLHAATDAPYAELVREFTTKQNLLNGLLGG